MSDKNLSVEELEKYNALTEQDVFGDIGQYKWDEEFQRYVLGMLLNDKHFLVQSVTLIKPEYFIDESHRDICDKLFKYYNTYKLCPEKLVILQEIKEHVLNKDDKVRIRYLSELNTLYEYYVPGLDTREYLLDKITTFAKVEALRVAFKKSIDFIKKHGPNEDKTWMEVYGLLQGAMQIDRNFEMGLEYFQSYEDRYERMKMKKEFGDIFTSGFPRIDEALVGGGPQKGQIYAWVGLCFAKHTGILMYNGSVKMVQDIKVGDRVMGPDSKPRKVLSLSHGRDQMYMVKPVKGDPYIVNSHHILSLKNSCKTPHKRPSGYIRPNVLHAKHPSKMGDTNIFNISIKDYLKETNSFKSHMKGWRTGVDFPYKEVKIDPYFLGVWLGDGDSNCCSITSEDKEIVDCLYDESSKRSLQVTKKDKLHYNIIVCSDNYNKYKNTLNGDLRHYELLKRYITGQKVETKKHIPTEYKINSREVRLQLLAGILDTDGGLQNSCFDIIQKSKTLAEDILYLVRSLGLAAYMTECTKTCQNGFSGKYHRISISGDCSQIPTRLPRKKSGPRRQIKDHLVTGIKVIPLDRGEYFGFSVDKDHLFLLSDFTVVHNSGSGKSLCLVTSAVKNICNNRKVLYVSLEMDEDSIAERFDAQFANVSINKLEEMQDIVKLALNKEIKERQDEQLDERTLVIKQFPAGSMDVNMLRAYLSQLKSEGFVPELLIVDYVGEMKDFPGIPTWESRYRIVRDLRGLATEEDICIFTALQPNKGAREAQKTSVIDDDNLADAFGQIRPLDGCWSINQMKVEKEAGIARIFVVKHRHGKSRFDCFVEYDPQTLQIRQISKEVYNDRLRKQQNERKASSSELSEELAQGIPKKAAEYWKKKGGGENQDD